jgi:hypothetical protein
MKNVHDPRSESSQRIVDEADKIPLCVFIGEIEPESKLDRGDDPIRIGRRIVREVPNASITHEMQQVQN